VLHQVNLRGKKKHHDTIRDMMAASSHVPSSISSGGTQWVYSGRLIVVSARTNKRNRHQREGHGIVQVINDFIVRGAKGQVARGFEGGQNDSPEHIVDGEFIQGISPEEKTLHLLLT
jgi:hypothetical protein